MKILINKKYIIDLALLEPGKNIWERGQEQTAAQTLSRILDPHTVDIHEALTVCELIKDPVPGSGVYHRGDFSKLPSSHLGRKFNTHSLTFWKILSDAGTLTAKELCYLLTIHSPIKILFRIITKISYACEEDRATMYASMLKMFFQTKNLNVARKLLVYAEKNNQEITYKPYLLFLAGNCVGYPSDGAWILKRLTKYAFKAPDPLKQAVLFLTNLKQGLLPYKDINKYISSNNLDFCECLGLAASKTFPNRTYLYSVLTSGYMASLPLLTLLSFLDSPYIEGEVRKHTYCSVVRAILESHLESLSRPQISFLLKVGTEVDMEGELDEKFLRRYVEAE